MVTVVYHMADRQIAEDRSLFPPESRVSRRDLSESPVSEEFVDNPQLVSYLSAYDKQYKSRRLVDRGTTTKTTTTNMTPSPGRIHQLPVKVHYSLEGINQSYLTVLDATQDVFVHPGQPGYGSDDEPGPIGSTYLKSIAQGVCYAR